MTEDPVLVSRSPNGVVTITLNSPPLNLNTVGSTAQLGETVAVRYDGAASEIRRSPPRSGADTSAVLQPIGRTTDDVDRLREKGVLGTPRAPGDAPTVQPNFYSSKDPT
jgi:hypothetical protein